jgi:hypothetical protein
MKLMTAPEVVTRKGKPVSVILPIRDYLDLVERSEDAVDVAWLKKSRQRSTSFRPLERFLRK